MGGVLAERSFYLGLCHIRSPFIFGNVETGHGPEFRTEAVVAVQFKLPQ